MDESVCEMPPDVVPELFAVKFAVAEGLVAVTESMLLLLLLVAMEGPPRRWASTRANSPSSALCVGRRGEVYVSSYVRACAG